MKARTQALPGRRRRVTDEQVYQLQTWMTFTQLARKIGICTEHAKRIRQGLIHYKNPSP